MVFRNKLPKKRPDIESKSALELLQEERECEIIKTNISRLDQELSGGIRMGTITDLFGFSLKSQFALQLVMNTILPKPHGLAGKVLWISVYEKANIVKTLKESIEDAAKHYKSCQEDIDRMNESVMIKQVVGPIQFTATIFQLVEMVRTNAIPDLKLIIFDNFARLLKRVPEQLDLIRLLHEFLQCLDFIAAHQPCAIVLINDTVYNFEKSRKISHRKPHHSALCAFKIVFFKYTKPRVARSRYKSALGQSFSSRMSYRLRIDANTGGSKATIRLSRNIHNGQSLKQKCPLIFRAQWKKIHGNSYGFCNI